MGNHGLHPSTLTQPNPEPESEESDIEESSTSTWSVLLIYDNPLSLLNQKLMLCHLQLPLRRVINSLPLVRVPHQF